MLLRRPYLDLSISILQIIDGDVQLLDLKDFVQDRQCEIEVNLDPGSYIILPRTTGCTLRRPQETIAPPNSQYRAQLM